ncbi:MAG: hypothetical protein KF773_29465 [Deltaproteobacteria bacterium]|nr:hypothetical protein [Deltaproteobacteria bacterium]
MSPEALKVLMMIFVPALIGAFVVHARISRGRKNVHAALAARGLAVGPATPDLPLSPFLPGKPHATWAARLSPSAFVYGAKGDRIVLAWRSAVTGLGRFVLYSPPGLGNWFHRELVEVKRKELPFAGLAYADAVGRDAVLHTGAGAAFAQLARGEKSWCMQYVDGMAYVLSYSDDFPADLERLVAMGEQIEQALGRRA